MSKRKSNALISLIIALIMSIIGYFASDDEFNISKSNFIYDEVVFDDNGLLKVHYVDVGQGDCTVIELPDDKIMLIDAGENGMEYAVFDFLKSINVKKIDYLVATHPHSDHIGGMPEVIEAYEIGEIYMPDATHSSATFEKMIRAISKKGLSINKAVSGKNIFSFDNLSADILSPEDKEYENLNNYSVVVRLIYGEKSFLFCGDIEKDVENEIFYKEIACDVLKVAHHGSSTSSTHTFLKKANPKAAVISCGEDNEYGHPHNEVLNRLLKTDTEIFRTDINGTVSVISDGKDIKVECER